jgi:hypothetical protein
MSFRIENARATGETDKGIWVVADDLDDSEFIPQSQIDDDSEVWKKGDEGTLIISDWLARERGWE